VFLLSDAVCECLSILDKLWECHTVFHTVSSNNFSRTERHSHSSSSTKFSVYLSLSHTQTLSLTHTHTHLIIGKMSSHSFSRSLFPFCAHAHTHTHTHAPDEIAKRHLFTTLVRKTLFSAQSYAHLHMQMMWVTRKISAKGFAEIQGSFAGKLCSPHGAMYTDVYGLCKSNEKCLRRILRKYGALARENSVLRTELCALMSMDYVGNTKNANKKICGCTGLFCGKTLFSA